MHPKVYGGAIADVGNVIIDHVTAQTTSEKVNTPGWYRTIPPAPGVFEGLKALCDAFGGNVTLVYNAQATADILIREWLAEQQLTERTGIPLSRVVRTTHGRDKTPFMLQASETHHGTTVIIDDRIEVMHYFLKKYPVPPTLFLYCPQPLLELSELAKKPIWHEIETMIDRWHHMHVVSSWAEITKTLNLT